MELNDEQVDQLYGLLESIVQYLVLVDEQAAVLLQKDVEYSPLTTQAIDTKAIFDNGEY